MIPNTRAWVRTQWASARDNPDRLHDLWQEQRTNELDRLRFENARMKRELKKMREWHERLGIEEEAA